MSSSSTPWGCRECSAGGYVQKQFLWSRPGDELSCHFLQFLPLVPVTSFVLALLIWPWGGPVQGPGVDGNLPANRKRQACFQLDQLPEQAYSIMELLVPGEGAWYLNRMSFCGLSVRHVFHSFSHLLSLLWILFNLSTYFELLISNTFHSSKGMHQSKVTLSYLIRECNRAKGHCPILCFFPFICSRFALAGPGI